MNLNKKYFTLFAFAAFSSQAFAAGEVVKESFNSVLFWAFVIAVVFLLVALAALNKSLNTIKYITLKQAQTEVGEETAAQIAEQNSFMNSLTDAVPVEKEADILLDHDYDGIKELDNNLPPWWVAFFYVTIIYAIFYYAVWPFVGIETNQHEEFKQEMAQAQADVDAYLAKMGDLVDENNVTVMEGDADLAAGKEMFAVNCVACHAADGGGNSIGPNLTDDYWLNGDGSIAEIFKMVKYGRPEKGMQSWKGNFGPKKMQQIASYVYSLNGTTPTEAKEPQGDHFPRGGASAEEVPVEESVTDEPESEATEETAVEE